MPPLLCPHCQGPLFTVAGGRAIPRLRKPFLAVNIDRTEARGHCLLCRRPVTILDLQGAGREAIREREEACK